MSRNYDGERWQSRSNGSRSVRNRPKRRHREKPRERGLRFATESKPRPGVNAGPNTAYGGQGPWAGLWIGRFPNAATADKARGRAVAKESDPMPPQRRRPVMGLGLGRFPNADCGRDQKVVHVDNLGKVPEGLENND
jgi:hypothetical protein